MKTDEKRCPDCFKGNVVNGACELCGFEIKTEKINSLKMTPFTKLNKRYILERV